MMSSKTNNKFHVIQNSTSRMHHMFSRSQFSEFLFVSCYRTSKFGINEQQSSISSSLVHFGPPFDALTTPNKMMENNFVHGLRLSDGFRLSEQFSFVNDP
jgi:hypothetical protein